MKELKEIRLSRDGGDCKVRLLVRGFGEQDLVSVDEVVAAVDALPRRHLSGFEEIRYDPSRRTQGLLAFFLGRTAGPRQFAQFVPLVNSIYIYRFTSRRQFQQILYHEIGHYVFQRVIGSVLRKQWVTGLYPRSRHVSEYAATNAAEDFAESYAAFLLQPELLRELPEKYAFVRDQVFENRPPQREALRLDLRL